MKINQDQPSTLTASKFDGDGRDKAYSKMRSFLLSCPSTKIILENAGAESELILEILIHAHLIGTKDGACFYGKSIKIINDALPLIVDELDQKERQIRIHSKN